MKFMTLYLICLSLWLLPLSVFSSELETEYDGGIIVPERKQIRLLIYKGGADTASRNWNNTNNIIWSMDIRNADGVAAKNMDTYNSIWGGRTSLNDVKRVIHNGKIHLIVVGNGKDGLAMYEFESKKCVFWSNVPGGPHDVAYLPGGYLVVANPQGGNNRIEIFDTRYNNKGPIPGTAIPFKVVHSVHWDGLQQLLWVWGNELKSYRLEVSNSVPKLIEVAKYIPKVPDIPDFYIGTGHGGSPMLVDDRRYLLLAAKQGILQFDTQSHSWTVYKEAPERSGIFSNPKGLSYNNITAEVIIAKASDTLYSADEKIGKRQINNTQFYKARWFQHNEFSFPSVEKSIKN